MEKLADVASIVIDVGESCQAHGLVEEDLPEGVRKILKSLHRYVWHILFAFRCLTYAKRFGWHRRCIETVYRDKRNQEGATACGHAPEGQEI
jgi:hypothetical protein